MAKRTKSRSFSIYLLKEGYDATNALREEHRLDADINAKNLPPNATLLILDSNLHPPWWKSYFDIEKDLNQVTKGSLVFLPVSGRCFALSFGHVAHNLIDTAYEYDFGLRVTLNSVDPHKLRSTDTLDPGAAKRQRTQLPIESELTLFDFDHDSLILRNLTGQVRDEHKAWFRRATGGSNLRISTDTQAEGLTELCEKLLCLYQSEDYKDTFPGIQNIAPVRDPAQIEKLNDKLLAGFQTRNSDLNITVPDIINYRDSIWVRFSGIGPSKIYEDVRIENYYKYLDEHGKDLNSITIEDFRHQMLVLTDENGNHKDRYSIFKSFIFDTTLKDTQNETFYLCEGNWYRIDKSYIERLNTRLDELCKDSDLPSYSHKNEGEYNQDVAEKDATFACLDKENISPNRQTSVEPCDLLAVRNDIVNFYHIKISTHSAQLSHLFNQGINSIELIHLEPEVVEKLENLIKKTLPDDANKIALLIRERKYCIIFGIVTQKDPANKSLNLPLFSRISLMRGMKALRLMNIPGYVMFITDKNTPTAGRKKTRKKTI